MAGAEDLAEGTFAEHFLDFELIGAVLYHRILLVGRGNNVDNNRGFVR